jgi:hypothetical protein
MSSAARKSRFPYILNSVLNQGFESIYWCEDCSSFAIKDENEFAQLLPLYFKSKNLSAFKRNLSHYGFKKAPIRRGCAVHTTSLFSTKEVSVYYHESFKRDDMIALESMRVISCSKKDPGGPDTDTGFVAAQKPSAQAEEMRSSREAFFTAPPRIEIPEASSMPEAASCGFKTKSGLTPITCRTGSTLAPPGRRGSACGVTSELKTNPRRSSLHGNNTGDFHHRRGSLDGSEPAVLFDRISGVSLCHEDFHLRDSNLRQSHLSNPDFSCADLRWSIGSARHSLHSLEGIDLSKEAYLRDQTTEDDSQDYYDVHGHILHMQH